MTIKQHAYLFDATRCIDCRACMIACSVENQVEMGESHIWLTGAGVMGTYPDLKRASMPYHFYSQALMRNFKYPHHQRIGGPVINLSCCDSSGFDSGALPNPMIHSL
jgi:ferredoxin